MTTGSFMARSGCKACGAQPSPTALTQPVWCDVCGSCFQCGEPNIVGRVAFHACPHESIPSGFIRQRTAAYVEGREAPMEACEMPASSGGAEWVATVERCARAALDGYEGNDPPMYPHDWGQLPEADRDAWREVARTVLAAAARGGK